MNDLMSLASPFWKDFALARSGVRAGHRVLDVAAGSGDMTTRSPGEASGRVVMTDINATCWPASGPLLDKGIGPNIDLLLADAETLPPSRLSLMRQHRLAAYVTRSLKPWHR